MVSYILIAVGVFFACGLVWLAWELCRAPFEEELWPDSTKETDDTEHDPP